MTQLARASINLLLGISPLFAAEMISFGAVDRNALELAAYERAVRISPVDPKDGDQVRIWYVNLLDDRVNGFLVTRKGARKCVLPIESDADGVAIERGRCTSLRPHRAEAARALDLLKEVAKLNGASRYARG